MHIYCKKGHLGPHDLVTIGVVTIKVNICKRFYITAKDYITAKNLQGPMWNSCNLLYREENHLWYVIWRIMFSGFCTRREQHDERGCVSAGGTLRKGGLQQTTTAEQGKKLSHGSLSIILLNIY